MSNIFNNNFHNLRLEVNNDEYWDFFLDNDGYDNYPLGKGDSIYDGCLISFIDVSLYDCVFDDEINSLPNYKWDYATSIKSTLKNIGYTGFDNGLLYFRKDMIMNSDFIKLYMNSTYDISDDGVLRLHRVTGSTTVYEYPLTVFDDYVKLNGGFYQGFFKTKCDIYQTLPSQLNVGDTWGYEFVLKKCEFEKESDKTLNEKYPNNKGIFFYIGTRAENKWVYQYNKDDNGECFTLDPSEYVEDAELDVNTFKIDAFLDMKTEIHEIEIDNYISYKYKVSNSYNHTRFDDFDGYVDFEEDVDDKAIYNFLSDCSKEQIFDIYDGLSDFYNETTMPQSCEYDYIEDDLDISDFTYETDLGLTIGKDEDFIDTDNKFLFFDRTCSGFNVSNWEEGNIVRFVYKKHRMKDNLFLLMNRTCTGYTINDIEKLQEEYSEPYDIYKDLYNNALSFRITDDGEIGYRYLVADCDENREKPYKILEGYSKKHIIKENEWCVIHVKISASHGTMQLRFYVNGVLVFVTDELPKLKLRELDDAYEKQETVPFNISLGGGTQGLCDTILPNYMIEPYRVYPLEEHFGGSFIGYFKSFKMYDCDVEFKDINGNFNFEKNIFDNLK